MDGYVVVGTKLDTKDFDAQIKEVQYELDQIEYELSKKKELRLDSRTISEYEAKAEKLNNRLIDLRKRQEDLNRSSLKKVQLSMDKISESTGNTIKKIGKWALAIFSVRTAYGAIRNAMSTLSQYNEKMATQLNSIKLIFATALEPIITRIISLVNTLLNYVNYIAKAWFNVDLFANASAKSMKDGAGSAEKMRKSMAGFDEMNVVTDNGSSASGGGGGAGFQAPENVPIPSWLEWIGNNGNTVKDIIIGIGSAIAGLKLAELLQTLGLFGSLPLWQLAGGIGLIIWGVVTAIEGVVNFINDPSWQNFLTILQGISLVVAGIAVLMGGWVVALVALGVAIVASIIENWDKVKEILGVVGTWINKNIVKPVAKFFVNLWDNIVKGVKNAVKGIKNAFSTVISFFSSIISKIVSLFRTIGTKVGDAISGAFKAVVNGVLTAIENILNSPIRAVNSLINTINKVPGINISKLSTFSLPRLAVGGVVNMPGRGINYGNANIGERGAEGVIPLTNSQMMAQLGEAIGKYVNINATVPVYVGNRQIAREIKKINADSDFAFNR